MELENVVIKKEPGSAEPTINHSRIREDQRQEIIANTADSIDLQDSPLFSQIECESNPVVENVAKNTLGEKNTEDDVHDIFNKPTAMASCDFQNLDEKNFNELVDLPNENETHAAIETENFCEPCTENQTQADVANENFCDSFELNENRQTQAEIGSEQNAEHDTDWLLNQKTVFDVEHKQTGQIDAKRHQARFRLTEELEELFDLYADTVNLGFTNVKQGMAAIMRKQANLLKRQSDENLAGAMFTPKKKTKTLV